VRTTDRALQAALTVAKQHGLPTRNARILRDLTNVLVHLAPAPVVARVPLTLARLRPRAWFAREIELVTFLASAGAPVAPPSGSVDPGPHRQADLFVSFWDHMDHDEGRFDPVAAGRVLRELHRAIERYPGKLPSFDRLGEVSRLLATLQPSSLVFERELDALRELSARLFPAPKWPSRPLHGDAHFRNILWTSEGPVWNDFENACRGPVAYDLACLKWRDAPGTKAALAAYGPYEEQRVADVTPFLALFLAAWTIVVVSRSPSEAGAAEARRRIARALEH